MTARLDRTASRRWVAHLDTCHRQQLHRARACKVDLDLLHAVHTRLIGPVEDCESDTTGRNKVLAAAITAADGGVTADVIVDVADLAATHDIDLTRAHYALTRLTSAVLHPAQVPREDPDGLWDTWQGQFDWGSEYLAALTALTPWSQWRPDELVQYRVPRPVAEQMPGNVNLTRFGEYVVACRADLATVMAHLPVFTTARPSGTPHAPMATLVTWSERVGPDQALLFQQAGLTLDEGLNGTWDENTLRMLAALRRP